MSKQNSKILVLVLALAFSFGFASLSSSATGDIYLPLVQSGIPPTPTTSPITLQDGLYSAEEPEGSAYDLYLEFQVGNGGQAIFDVGFVYWWTDHDCDARYWFFDHSEQVIGNWFRIAEGDQATVFAEVECTIQSPTSALCTIRAPYWNSPSEHPCDRPIEGLAVRQ